MGYFSKENAKLVREGMKIAFKGVPKAKFSVTVHNHSSINVVAMRGPFNFPTDGEQQLNEYHPEFYENDTKKYLEVAKLVIEEVAVQVDRNAGDVGADYPNCNFYQSISIGKWDREFEKVDGKVNWKQVKENLKLVRENVRKSRIKEALKK
jgi:hypothetical protein